MRIHDRIYGEMASLLGTKVSLLSIDASMCLLSMMIDTKFSILEQHLRGNVKRFRGGLEFTVHRFAYHSTLGLRVIKKKIRRCRETRSYKNLGPRAPAVYRQQYRKHYYLISSPLPY